MKIKITCRLRGTSQQYFVGRITNAAGDVVVVHTGKTRSYVVRQLQEKSPRSYWIKGESPPSYLGGLLQEFVGDCPKDRD